MIALGLLACGESGPAIALPDAPGASARATTVVVVTPTEVWLDATGTGGERVRTDVWAEATTQGMVVPGLSVPLAALPADAPDPAVAADATVPFELVARILVTLGQSGRSGAELRTSKGAVAYSFPTFCGGSPTDEAARSRIAAALASAPTGPCLAPAVTSVEGGLRVELLEIPQDRPGCTVAVAGRREPGASGWRDAVALPAAGACPSVTGRDDEALTALLARTSSLVQACGSAFVSFPGDAPWGDVLPVYAAVKARHDAASLGVSGDARPDCDRGFVLP